jgi:hypothetical protein
MTVARDLQMAFAPSVILSKTAFLGKFWTCFWVKNSLMIDNPGASTTANMANPVRVLVVNITYIVRNYRVNNLLLPMPRLEFGLQSDGSGIT